jgi:hypothetical protein
MSNDKVEETRSAFRPDKITTLFVGESAPASGDFFYYGTSGMTRYLRQSVEDAFGPTDNFLASFKGFGWYLDDLVLTPVDKLGKPERIAACRAAQPSSAHCGIQTSRNRDASIEHTGYRRKRRKKRWQRCTQICSSVSRHGSTGTFSCCDEGANSEAATNIESTHPKRWGPLQCILLSRSHCSHCRVLVLGHTKNGPDEQRPGADAPRSFVDYGGQWR